MKYVCKQCNIVLKDDLIAFKNTRRCRHYCERAGSFWQYSHKVSEDSCEHDRIQFKDVKGIQDKKFETREKILAAHNKGKLGKYMYTPSVVDGKPTLKPSTLSKYGA